MPRGVVFDFDGVIAKSMEMHAAAYRRILAPLGVRVRDADVFVLEGARSETIIRELLGEGGPALSESEFRHLADSKQKDFASHGPPPLYPAAEAMVRAVARSVPRIGVVTGTRRENLERAMPQLMPLFSAVLAQDAYAHDKPHPEPYEKSAAALGLAPRDCAAVENAARGVRSAKAAGFGLVIAMATTLDEATLRGAGADAVVVSHDDVAPRIRAWISSSTAGSGVPRTRF